MPVPPNWIGVLIKGAAYLATFAMAGYAAWKLHHEYA
jgi:hypothetical protein